MRPRGSTNGRVPPGGYPEVGYSLGAFLAGFIEGEGSFGISRQTRGSGFRCHASLTARDDDSDLIGALAIETRLGRTIRKRAYRGSRPQIAWTITAKSDCLRLSEILDEFPIRGRKSAEFALWRGALRWWIDGDPTCRRPDRDWTPMRYLSANLKHAKLYGASCCPSYPIDSPSLEPDWLPYLSGFITAEGHFAIHDGGGGPKPRLVLRVRADDRALLDELRRRTSVGHVYTYPRRSGAANPVSMWQVFSFSDLTRTIDLLDQSPPRGRKFREYEIWREAVVLVNTGTHRAPAGRARMERLATAIRATRQYSPA